MTDQQERGHMCVDIKWSIEAQICTDGHEYPTCLSREAALFNGKGVRSRLEREKLEVVDQLLHTREFPVPALKNEPRIPLLNPKLLMS